MSAHEHFLRNQYTQGVVIFDVARHKLLRAAQSVQDGVLCPVQLVHDISLRLKEFAARILISYQFPSNDTF
jgi:hypothetical protein